MQKAQRKKCSLHSGRDATREAVFKLVPNATHLSLVSPSMIFENTRNGMVSIAMSVSFKSLIKNILKNQVSTILDKSPSNYYYSSLKKQDLVN